MRLYEFLEEYELDSTDITSTLSSMNDAFDATTEVKTKNLYSKLAIIESCGWIEQNIDELLNTSINNKTQNKELLALFKDRLDKTFGFGYKKHLRPLLLILLGVSNLEAYERNTDQNIYLNFVSELENLKQKRDTCAHTHITGTTPSLDAPSLTIARFNKIVAGFTNLERVL